MPEPRRHRAVAGLALALLAAGCAHAAPRFGPADPVAADPAQFDARRPLAPEFETSIADGFTVAAVGDLIISRPLSQYAQSLPAFAAVVERLQQANVAVGNLETTIFDARTFTGSPYSMDGDWTNASLPAVAGDLRRMGIAMVSRANNHALDWGLEGMRETGRWLDEAGIVHAGAGETHGIARAPQYLETPQGRVGLVSFASTFRPTSESLPPQGAANGRPGLSALHLEPIVSAPRAALQALAEFQCRLTGGPCAPATDEMDVFGTRLRAGERYETQYAMDAGDVAEILRAVRAAQLNADLVIATIHAHECSLGCDVNGMPRGAADFLRRLAHEAIDSGADVFVVTGNHNLGPIEIYESPRGRRPVFYGLGNFFWSDVQELLPQDLFRRNRERLARAWEQPELATEYDLSAPLNTESFANTFTFESVIAESVFEHGQLARIVLHPIEEGYGKRLPESGIPRKVSDAAAARAIIAQITTQTASYGLPALELRMTGSVATVTP